MKKLIIFDANSILNRAFYGIRPLTTKDGLPTNAIYGYINILKKHLDAINPDFAAAAFDLKAPTFRHESFADYKATRKKMPEELCVQLPYIREATEALGITILEKEGYEADDILGTVSKKAANEGIHAVIVTGDRDSFQLVDENITVILASTSKDVEYTPEKIRDEYGLESKQLIDVKALAGDSSDNIPGVKGIGEKTAIKLISQCQTLDKVFENLDSLNVGQAVKEKLASGKDDAVKSRFLAEICLTVPDMPDTDKLARKEIQKNRFRELLIKLEFSRLLKTFSLEETLPEKPAPEKSALPEQLAIDFANDRSAENEIQTITPEELLKLAEGKTVYLTFSEKDFFVSEGENIFVIKGENTDKALKKIKPVVFDYKAYCHHFNAHFKDISGLGAKFDAYLAAYILNPADSAVTLSKLSLLYLNRSVSPALEADPVFALGLLLKLYEILSAKIKDENNEDLYYNIELPLVYTLAKMEICGFAISSEGLIKYGETLKEKIRETEEKIYSLAGEVFNINSPKQLAVILFEKLNLPTFKKTKTGYSTNAETLEKLKPYSPLIVLILEYRSYTKLYSTYVEGLLKAVSPDGRIHTRFNQTLTQTGRLSSLEPNLQNIPVRTPLGRELRRFFISQDSNSVLVDADYSQIELRVLAHISGDENLIRAFKEGEDIHTKTASEIFHVPLEAVTPEMRKSAKAVNFGIIYGISSFSLGEDIGVPGYVAADYIKRYFNTYPDVKKYMNETVKSAKEQGFVTTLFGRKRFIPELSSPKKTIVAAGERIAMNTPIQGTAADIIKIAMVNVDRRLEREALASRLVLQVHDELIIEAPESEAEYIKKLLTEEMENAVSLSVPLVAEAKTGKSWYDTK